MSKRQEIRDIPVQEYFNKKQISLRKLQLLHGVTIGIVAKFEEGTTGFNLSIVLWRGNINPKYTPCDVQLHRRAVPQFPIELHTLFSESVVDLPNFHNLITEAFVIWGSTLEIEYEGGEEQQPVAFYLDVGEICLSARSTLKEVENFIVRG